MSEVRIRQACERDVAGIREIFLAAYGEDYPYQTFLDDLWLKRSVFTDDILMLVAEDEATGQVLGTASVVFDIGTHSDLLGEFGRLAVHPDARGRGIGRRLMEGRVAFIENRLHIGIVENRVIHPFSQRISHAHGFAPVGFLPMKHPFHHRESVALFARHFGAALRLRCNHPRIVPEAHALAHLAMRNCNIPCDVIIDETAAAYPYDEDFTLQELTAEGLPLLVRIERGRLRNREIFGPMRLQYGFFKLSARHATYLVARRPDGSVAGAVGYIHDQLEQTLRIFELISRTELPVRFVLDSLMRRCQAWGVAYVEVDVSACAPRMQRTLVELGFLPVAYVPAMVFHEVERLDVLKMVRLMVPFDPGPLKLTPQTAQLATVVLHSFSSQSTLPQIADAVHRLALFSGLNAEQAGRLAGACTVRRFSDGAALWEEREPGDSLYILIEGKVSISREGRVIGMVPAGDVVGELSLLTGQPHSACARASGPVLAGALSQQALSTLSRQRPDIGLVLYRNLACSLGEKLRKMGARHVRGQPPRT